MKIADIYDELHKKRRCSKQSIHTLLSRLEKRGFIKTEKVECPVPYKLVFAVVKEEDYLAIESESILKKMFRGNFRKMVAMLVESEELSENDIEDLKAIIDRKKNK